MKTPVEIEALKENWEGDPIWDIENTEGFEEYRAELLAFRLETEERWRNQRLAELRIYADKLGCPGNITLAKYIESLEDRIRELEEK